MKKLLLILGIIIIAGGAFLFFSLNNTNNGTEPAQNKANSTQPETQTTSGIRLLEVILKIDAPFSLATISVDHNGLVRYNAKARNQEEVRDEAVFSSKQMQILLTTIESNNFFDLETVIDDEVPMIADGSVYTLSVKTVITGAESVYADASVHEVTCFQYSTCTQGFENIKEKIIELWGKDMLELGV